MSNPGILIIDDDPNLRKTLSDILRARGYRTFAAANGAEGLSIMESNEINVALIDLGLPDMPGMRVLERIKTGYPATEAIILTGNATLDSAVEATNRGAFSYLVKPYEIDQLQLLVRRADEKRLAGEKLVSHAVEMERANTELKILYEVSQVIGRTMDMDELLSAVLHKLVEIDIFSFERSAAAFLVEGDRLRLVSFLGLSEIQVNACSDIRTGECLCGLAVSSGEILISPNAMGDPRHCITYPGMLPHGNIAIPLKVVDRVIGVITLRTLTGTELAEDKVTLLSALGSQIGVAVNNARLFDEARDCSLRDPLTGLANRRFLDIQLDKAIETAIRHREKLSAIMLDIDHFKRYNDTHGHVEGDRLLVRIAGILLREIRSSDYVFRYGGEEFFVILPRTDTEKACNVAERLRKSVEADTGVTVSLGVSAYRDSMRGDEELIRAADKALYQAKDDGRNRVVSSA